MYFFIIFLVQLEASTISCLLCLISISVFRRVNFLLKGFVMVFTAIVHLTLYFVCIATDEEEEMMQLQR